MRHGQTEYTDIYPDLTPEGIRTIKRAALIIQSIVNEHHKLTIATSPMARAMGSTSIIAEALNCGKEKIRKEPDISAAVVRDEKEARAILDEYMLKVGVEGLCLAYGADPRFEDGKAIEPRSAVRERFLKYFASLIRQFLVNTGLLPCVIIISHYEFLYHFVESIFELNYKKDNPLGHGEVIEVSFFDIGIGNVVEMEVTFRKRTIIKNFDYAQKEII